MDTPIFAIMRMRIQHTFLIIMFTLLSTFSYGQWNNSFFDIERSDTQIGLIQLHVESLGYFRNSEFKSTIDQGRTLFGHQLWPEFTYQTSANVQVSLGMFIQQDFGADEVFQQTPTFSFQFRNKGHFFRFGTLLGATQHQLVEPIYDPERVIENRLENGFQYKRNSRKLDGEFWIDWHKMIYQNSPFREEFTTGVRVEPKLHTASDKHIISIPIAAISFHKGGEIDTSHMPTISNFNFDYALRYRYKSNGGFLDSFDFQAHALYYEDITTNPEQYIDGLGQYISAAFYAKDFGLMFNYYDAHQFHNPMGDVVFRSVSSRNSTYVFDYRKVVMVRLQWHKPIARHFDFLIRSNFMRNLKQETNDILAEFYFRWTPQFGLHQVKH
ncbi:MAG: hypothetical protein ACI9JN_001008 [Bacteroidia bacterium]|jgi:hypothetical protein